MGHYRCLSKRFIPKIPSASFVVFVTFLLIGVKGETSALLNLFRTLGGFSVTFFQVPWATKHGALQTFGCEAAVVAGLFLIVVPTMQLKGRVLRVSITDTYKVYPYYDDMRLMSLNTDSILSMTP